MVLYPEHVLHLSFSQRNFGKGRRALRQFPKPQGFQVILFGLDPDHPIGMDQDRLPVRSPGRRAVG